MALMIYTANVVPIARQVQAQLFQVPMAGSTMPFSPAPNAGYPALTEALTPQPIFAPPVNAVAVLPAPAVIDPAAPGSNKIVDFVKANPALVIGGSALVVYLLTRKKRR